MIRNRNILRNVKGGEDRLNMFKNRIGLFNVFTSKEMSIIFGYLKPYLKGIVFLIVLALVLSFLEGFKALSMVAFIKSLFMTSIESLRDFKILGRYELSKFIVFSSRYSLIVYIFLFFVVLSVLGLFVKLFISIFTKRLQLTLMRDLRKDLYNKIVSFDMDFFNEAKSGELLFMINAEVSRFSTILLHSKNLLSGSCTILILFAILFYMSAPITAIIVVFGVFFLIFHQKIERRLKIASWQSNIYLNTLQQLFYEIIYGIKLIKLGGLEHRERDEYINHHLKFEEEDMKMVKLRSISEAAREGFFIFIIAVFSFAFYYLMRGGLMKSDNTFILSYMVVLLRAIPYFSEFQSSILNIVESYGPLTKIINILTRPSEEKRYLSVRTYKTLDSIDDIWIKDLRFSYRDKGDILRGIDATFTKGKMYAIVGFSGEGKSTLLDLMVSMRMPKSGNILFNGVETEDIDPKILRDKIGYVNQEPLIFHDTLRENVTFFKKDVSQQDIDRAFDMAAIKDFVYSQEDGLNTGLGERGLTVSGGERQRIGLARVFLKDSEVLLLDEATNSLDYKTEKRIYDNLRAVKKDKIVIVVAHRLSSLVDFDEIIVLYNGRVEERGRHNDLMEKKGIYYSLCRLQESGKIDY